MGDRQNRQPDIGGNRGNDQTDEEMENEEGELEEVEPALSTQRGRGTSRASRLPMVTDLASAAARFRATARVCAVQGRVVWVATGRSCARFEASGEPESRHARRGGPSKTCRILDCWSSGCWGKPLSLFSSRSGGVSREKFSPSRVGEGPIVFNANMGFDVAACITETKWEGGRHSARLARLWRLAMGVCSIPFRLLNQVRRKEVP